MTEKVIKVSLDNKTETEVNATIIDDAFAVHRTVTWSPAEGEHKTSDSTWSVTHLRTGRRVEGVGQEITTKHQAVYFAKLLAGQKELFDFSSIGDVSDDHLRKLKELVSSSYTQTMSEAVVKKSNRFVVRRANRGYGVVDTSSGKTVDTAPHRGMAAIKANKLNEEDV